MHFIEFFLLYLLTREFTGLGDYITLSPTELSTETVDNNLETLICFNFEQLAPYLDGSIKVGKALSLRIVYSVIKQIKMSDFTLKLG